MEKEKREPLLKNIVGAIVIGGASGIVLAAIVAFITKNILTGIFWGMAALIPVLMSIADDLLLHVWSAKRSTRYIAQALVFIVAFGFMAPRLLRMLPPELLGQK